MSCGVKGITHGRRRPRYAEERAPGGRLLVRFPGLAKFADHVDEGLDGTGQAAVAAIDKREFAPEVDAFDSKELHFPGLDLIAGEAFADDGDTDIGRDESLDHSDAGKLHGDLQAGAVRAEKLVEDLAGVAGARKNQRRGGNFF